MTPKHLKKSFHVLSSFIFASTFLLAGCAQTLNPHLETASKISLSSGNIDARSKPVSRSEPSAIKSGLPKPADSANEALGSSPASKSGPDSSHTLADSDDGPMSPLFNAALNYCQTAQDFWEKGNPNKAISALDDAYACILKIHAPENSQLGQEKEDLRFTISKRILEIYASRHTTVKGNYNAIPVVLTPQVKTEIAFLLKAGGGHFFIDAYRRSGRYRPMIAAALKKAGLPVELSWLPLIESGFRDKAMSEARALGLWQFIPSTGYKFGLVRNRYIDERLDPVAATQAAIKYLKQLHQIFGDWVTVLAAYNCGANRVLQVIREQNVNYLDNFWDLYNRLPRETACYVPRFLATLYITSHLGKYGLADIKTEKPRPWATVKVDRQMRLQDVARALGTDKDTLAALNPELLYSVTPPTTFSLRVPRGKALALQDAIDSIPPVHPFRRFIAYHRVKSGETLWSIARKYHVRVMTLARSNKINRRKVLHIGMLLKIPTKGTALMVASASPVPDPPPVQRQTLRHIVKKGESLWDIARRYNTTPQSIRRSNHLTGNLLAIGQVLKIPMGGEQKTPKKVVRTYHVKQGDSVYAIAERHHMSLDRLLQINSLSSAAKIFPGEELSLR